MKRRLSKILLVGSMMLCTLASCGEEKKPSNLENAKAYVRALYKDKKVATPSDYDVVSVVTIDGVQYRVVWTVNNDKVKVVAGDKLTTIDVDEKSESEVAYTLTATIIDEKGNKVETSFDHSVPMFKVYSYSEFKDLATGSTGSFRGIVSGIMAKSKGNSTNCLYLNANDGGFYIYNLSSDPVTELGLEIGDQVLATGSKDVYSGTLEIVNTAIEIENKGAGLQAPVDVTNVFNSLTTVDELKTTMAQVPQAQLVTIKGAEIQPVSASDESSGYYRFKNANGVSTYVRISSSVCPLTSEEQVAFKQGHTSHVGYVADITGVVCAYDGAFYITPVSANAEANYSLPKLSDAEIVAKEKENLSFEAKFGEDTTGTMAVTGATYTEALITWSSDNADAIKFDNALGTYTVTCLEADTTVKVTATIRCGESVDTKEFEVIVEAAPTDLYLPAFYDAPKAGSFKFAMDTRVVDEKVLYATDVVNAKGALETTDKATKAVDFEIIEVEGGYNIKVGEQYLVAYLNGTYTNLKFDAEPCLWNWNEEFKIFTTIFNEVEYYLGSYLNTKTNTVGAIALNKISYISGNNASKIGVSQFPALHCSLKPADYKANFIQEAKEGVQKIAMDTRVVDGRVLYATDTVNSKGALETTDKPAKGIDFVIEASEDGYSIRYGEQYLVAYKNGNYTNLKFDAEKYSWRWNEEFKLYTTISDGIEYYLGSYLNTKTNTVGAIALNKISYISGDNAAKIGVSQFPAQTCQLELAEVAPKYISAPVAGSFKAALNTSAVDGKVLYATASINEKGALETTDKISKAADFEVIEVEGGYNIKIGEQYLVGALVGSYKNLVLQEEAGLWKWNEECKVFVCDIEGVDYYFGSYLNTKTNVVGNTMALSKLSYISGENVSKIGVSQFPAQFCTIEFVD